MRLTLRTLLLSLTALALSPTPAAAYLGPGLGLGAISTAFGILGAIVLGLISLLWYPLKRLTRRIFGRSR